MDNQELTFSYRDEFKRKTIAEKIITLLDSDIDIFPMAIDGGWGTGKTEFCIKLIHLMNEEQSKEGAKKKNIIYFDAFEAEPTDQPLLYLLAKIREVIPEKEKKKLTQKIAPVAKVLVKAAGKAILQHTLKTSADDLTEEISKAATDSGEALIDMGVESLLETYAKSKENIDALKAVLTESVKETPLVIFIDELDRCRPDFALTIFELTKHIFDIPEIKIFFSINSEQMKSIIKNRYGNSIDAEIYLEKFIHFSIHLQNKVADNRTHTINAMNIIYKHLEKECYIFRNNYNDTTFKIIDRILFNNNISLRCSEKIINGIKIYNTIGNCKINADMVLGYKMTMIIGVIIFTINKVLSQKILNNSVTIDDLNSFFGEADSKNDKTILEIIKYLIVYRNISIEEISEKYEISKKEVQEYLALLGGGFYDLDDNSVKNTLKEVLTTLNFASESI